MALAVLAPATPQINVRWRADLPEAQRTAAERELGLRNGTPQREATWSYDLTETSREAIRRIVAHPLAEDTAHLDRGTLAYIPPGPPIRLTLYQLYEREPFKTIAARWWQIAALCLLATIAISVRRIHAVAIARPADAALVLIVIASAALRVVLVGRGGQMYWPDETRYEHVRTAVAGLIAGTTGDMREAFGDSSHVLFKVLAVVPAAIESVRGADPKIPAAFIAMFSTLDIWLMAGIARRAGATSREAVIAAGLLAASTSFALYSRHLLPYDVAMTFGLLALRAAIEPESRWRSSLACGLLAGCTFLTYNGYWTLGGVACLLHVFSATGLRSAIARALGAGAGLALAVVAMAAAYAAAGQQLLAGFVSFAGTVTQGEFAEGWSLPFEYLWHTEHLLLCGWILALLWCGWRWRRFRAVRTARVGAVGALLTYAALAGLSSLHVFVVYGRLARQMVPFLCLVSAAVLACVPERRRTPVLAAVAVAVLAQAALNLAAPVMQQFPVEFTRQARDMAQALGATDSRLVNTYHIYPTPPVVSIPPGFREALAARHPLQYLPYQYEGFTPGERRLLRTTDIRMRLFVRQAEGGTR